MAYTDGVGERLALVVSGALLLAVFQVVQAKRRENSESDQWTSNRETPKSAPRTFLEILLGSRPSVSSVEVNI